MLRSLLIAPVPPPDSRAARRPTARRSRRGPSETRTHQRRGYREEVCPTNARMEVLAKDNPVAFSGELPDPLRTARSRATASSCKKQERLQNKLEKKEIIEVHYREGPAKDGHSVFMRWAGRGPASRPAPSMSTVRNMGPDGRSKMIVKPDGTGQFS